MNRNPHLEVLRERCPGGSNDSKVRVADTIIEHPRDVGTSAGLWGTMHVAHHHHQTTITIRPRGKLCPNTLQRTPVDTELEGPCYVGRDTHHETVSSRHTHLTVAVSLREDDAL